MCGQLVHAQPARVVGYYPAWNRTKLTPSSIDFTVVTHVIHAFANPNTNGTIATGSGIPDAALISAAHAAGRKVLLSFGGAGAYAGFDAVVPSPALRASFIQRVCTFLTTNGYDGIDIDWEEPAPMSTVYRDSLVSFVREFRTAFDQVNPGLLITMAIPVSPYWGKGYNFTALSAVVNWFNAMTYDYHGSWSAHAGHNAPLYAPGDVNDYSVDQSVQYLKGIIPAAKLTLGIPFYGKRFNGASAVLGSYTSVTDYAYTDIVTAAAAGGWTYVWDAGACVPYYLGGNGMMTFEDSASIAGKCAYAKTKGLGGIMIWELSHGLVGSRQPLLAAVGAAVAGWTGVAEQPASPRPEGFVLNANYPNPFNPSTTVSYVLDRAEPVTVEILDMLGRTVQTLCRGEVQTPGLHRRTVSLTGCAAGVYWCVVSAGSDRRVRPMMLLK